MYVHKRYGKLFFGISRDILYSNSQSQLVNNKINNTFLCFVFSSDVWWMTFEFSSRGMGSLDIQLMHRWQPIYCSLYVQLTSSNPDTFVTSFYFPS